MVVYRICKKAYVNDLSGIGAGLYGGRWNPKGINLLYTAGTIALAYVEFLVHNYHLLSRVNVCLAAIEINSDDSMHEVNDQDFPDDWNEDPEFIHKTKEMGKDFAGKKKHYILKVPSAIVPGEYNYLLNPSHKQHHMTKIIHITDPMKYDKRLLF